MKKFIYSFVLLVTIATGLHSAPPRSLLPMDRSKLKQVKYQAIPSKHPRSPRMNVVTHANSSFTSTNWSGYAALTNLKNPENCSVEVVSGAWVVPQVIPPLNPAQSSFSAIFVGIDGATESSKTVQQIGTEQDWNGTTLQGEYFAWVELYPLPTQVLNPALFPVRPGDLIGAEVAYIGHDKFQFSIMNFSLGIYVVLPTVKVPGAKRQSAEWIVEAPTDSTTGNILPLANFAVVPFLHCTAKIEGDTGAISDDDWKHEAIVMVETNSDTIKAVPTKLKQDGEAFIVAWQSEGP